MILYLTHCLRCGGNTLWRVAGMCATCRYNFLAERKAL